MYTQSPWKWHKRKHSNTHFLANENETDDDYKVIDDGSAYGEYGASIDVESGNARLIAAAPELLEELQELVKCVVELERHYDFDSDTIVEDARAAIAKALGQ